MGYREALEAAGATVHQFEHFGSYQGTWLAQVTYDNQNGWIEGAYGSCSVCDSFQAEFDWDADTKADYKERLAEFGRGYLHGLVTTEHLVGIYKKKCEVSYAWEDDKEILAWLEKQQEPAPK